MDAKTGKVIWSNNTGGTVYGGLSVSNGCIYIGNGYKRNLLRFYFNGSSWMQQQSLCSSPQHFCLLNFTATTDSDVNTKQAAQKWPNHVRDLCNRRYTNKEKKISPETETVSKLHLKWKFYARGDISVTPAIVNDTIYFPSWNGNLYAVKASDGITCLEEEHAEAHWL
ncbi:hypothetical protein Q3G72_011254 [Acer saccharum]|nr:hypothetical protein Q3G72_011254 [Acer saccharum]